MTIEKLPYPDSVIILNSTLIIESHQVRNIMQAHTQTFSFFVLPESGEKYKASIVCIVG